MRHRELHDHAGEKEQVPGVDDYTITVQQRALDIILELVKRNLSLFQMLRDEFRPCIGRALAQLDIGLPAGSASKIDPDPADLEQALADAFEQTVPDIASHTKSVAQRAHMLSIEMGFPNERSRLIHAGGQLHDLGKVDTDVHTLISKPVHLSPKEKLIIEMHPVLSGMVLQAFDADPRVVAMAARHHQRFDGSGYPQRRMDDEIPLEVRMITAADVVDAILEDRPGKARKDVAGVLAALEKGSGKHFDPEIAGAFKAICHSGRL